MAYPRIYSTHALQHEAAMELRGSAARHIGRVLRLSAGDSVILFDGSGADHHAVITHLQRDRVTLDVGPPEAVTTESMTRIVLWQGLCRGSRMDTVIQKATELGVTAVEPFYAERGVVRMDPQRAHKRVERWREIAISACEQCGRATLPEIGTPVTFAEKIATESDVETKILLHPDATEPLGDLLQDTNSVALLVGPEGGFTPAEIEQATNTGFRTVRLGKRILRTETAPLTALSIIQYLKGDLR